MDYFISEWAAWSPFVCRDPLRTHPASCALLHHSAGYVQMKPFTHTHTRDLCWSSGFFGNFISCSFLPCLPLYCCALWVIPAGYIASGSPQRSSSSHPAPWRHLNSLVACVVASSFRLRLNKCRMMQQQELTASSLGQRSGGGCQLFIKLWCSIVVLRVFLRIDPAVKALSRKQLRSCQVGYHSVAAYCCSLTHRLCKSL